MTPLTKILRTFLWPTVEKNSAKGCTPCCAGRATVRGRHGVQVHGGKKLGVIKSTATGIEMDIDALGREPEPQLYRSQ